MVARLTRLAEEEARTLLENIRWPDGPICPECGAEAKRLGGAAGQKGQIKCTAKGCRKKFTVRIGSIFEDSKIPLRGWVYAFTRVCVSKKGIAAYQLKRELDVTYKTAWFMCHRIRYVMQDGNGSDFSGNIEADETYVGGKPRFQGQSKRGRGTKKVPVAALIERGGRAKAEVVPNVTAKTLKGFIRRNVDTSSTIHTGEHGGCRGIGDEFSGGHRVVVHSHSEYVRADGAPTNTTESFFALLKRGLYGVFHHVSPHHLQRYCDEFSFRWNGRHLTDEERVILALKSAEGKRLTYT